MSIVVYWLVIACFTVAIIAAAGVAIRAYAQGTTPSAMLFKPRPEVRVEVVSQASMDGRRKLLLIRRDDVEHLIMIGGPVDVVIETGIGERRSSVEPGLPLPTAAPATATVFTRPPRTLGQTSGIE